MNGAVLDFGEDAMRTTASLYAPEKGTAPLVLGHPDDNQPTFGQVRGLFVEDGDLYAQAVMDSALVALIKAQRYRYVSASFFSPFGSSNPTPGAFYLRHVGFLGAQPPALKGMTPVEFSERPDALHFCEAYNCDLSTSDCARVGDSAGLDHERWELHTTALDYQRVCPTLSYGEAVHFAGRIVGF